MGTLDRVMDHLATGHDTPDYACLNCDTGYEVQHHVCPECGSYSVERHDW